MILKILINKRGKEKRIQERMGERRKKRWETEKKMKEEKKGERKIESPKVK